VVFEQDPKLGGPAVTLIEVEAQASIVTAERKRGQGTAREG
jgi:hypothetical protein